MEKLDAERLQVNTLTYNTERWWRSTCRKHFNKFVFQKQNQISIFVSRYQFTGEIQDEGKQMSFRLCKFSIPPHHATRRNFPTQGFRDDFFPCIRCPRHRDAFSSLQIFLEGQNAFLKLKFMGNKYFQFISFTLEPQTI